MKAYSLLLGLILLVTAPSVLADKVYVAVASNFSQSMQLLQKKFESISEHQVVLTSGASGKFYAQIKQGAPYDLFFSADQAKPIALEQENYIVPDSRFTYATGRLAVWSSKAEFNQQVAQKFNSGSFNKLALANPKLAPYGQAAIQVLSHLNLLQSTQDKIVQGENVSQVYQFVDSGNADLGFVALSQLINQGAEQGQYWLVPEAFHQPIKQDVVWLKRAKNNQAAKAFFNFIRSDQAKTIIIEQGYRYPLKAAL